MTQSWSVFRRPTLFRSPGMAVLGAAALLWIGCSDQGDDPAGPLGSGGPGDGTDPELTSIVPARTYAGDEIRLLGSAFGATEGTVVFAADGGGTANATIVSWTDTEITAHVPSDAADGGVTVQVGTNASDPVGFEVAPQVSLADDVRPIFQAQGCLSCHGGSGGLFVTTHAGILAGGGRGPGVVPRDSAGSNIIKALQGDGIPLMPQGAPQPIPAAQILTIADWIDQGALDN
ncbi:MAG: c-type cytochrome domain-containing protein [Candidatus Eisenbacteria bacterium]